MNNADSLPERFRLKINFTESCWLWKAGKTSGGYGYYKSKGKQFPAHRFSWIHFKGSIPEGLFVCHKCDVRTCVNPDHLFLGNNQENTADRHNKGRTASLERNGNSKLTSKEIDEIRRLYRPGHAPFKSEFSTKSLAKRFGVSQTHICRIVNQQSWRSGVI